MNIFESTATALLLCAALGHGGSAANTLSVLDARGKRIGPFAGSIETARGGGPHCPGSAVVTELIGYLTTLHISQGGEESYGVIEPMIGMTHTRADAYGPCGTMYFPSTDCTGLGYINFRHARIPGTRASAVVVTASGRMQVHLSQGMNPVYVRPRSVWGEDGECLNLGNPGFDYLSIPLDVMIDLDTMYRRPYKLKIGK